MRKRLISFIFFSAILFILLANICFSIGLTPPRESFIFEGENSYDFKTTLLNTEKQDLLVEVKLEGDLVQYVDAPIKNFEIKSFEDTKEFAYRLNLPNYIGSPGVHEVKVLFLVYPSEKDKGVTNVVASAGLVSQVRVTVPKEGKYIDAGFIITNQNKKSQAVFTLPLHNVGTENISNVSAKIDIFSEGGNYIKTLNSGDASLPVFSESKLSSLLSASDLPNGKYLANATIYFDGHSISFFDRFRLGDSFLSLISFGFDDLKVGDILKVFFVYENSGNVNFKNVYNAVKVMDDKGAIVSQFVSEKKDISISSNLTLDAYWDTKDIHDGNYSLFVTTYYGDEKMDHSFIVSVNNGVIKGEGIEVVKKEQANWFLIFLVLVVLVFLALLVLNYRTKKQIKS